MNILFINNYDSFVYNLVNYICQLEPNSNVIIEDNNISLDYVASLNVDKIIIFPGPGQLHRYLFSIQNPRAYFLNLFPLFLNFNLK